MAITKTKKPDPDKIYIAWQGGAVDEYVIGKGTRLRGDHPAVKRMGEAMFVEDGTPESEWPTSYDGVISDAEAKPAPPKPQPKVDDRLPLREFVRAVQGILTSKWGSIAEGTVIHQSDPRALNMPEAFRPLAETIVLEMK